MGNRSVSDTGIAGFVINPRNGQPVLIEWDGERVDIYRWKPDKGDDVSREGRGYFERGSDEGAELSNYPRVHTPSGVSTKGQGFGTTLYTGLCLVAHGAAEGKWRIPPYEDGDGISSTPGSLCSGCGSTGIPRPSSATSTEPSLCSVTSMVLA